MVNDSRKLERGGLTDEMATATGNPQRPGAMHPTDWLFLGRKIYVVHPCVTRPALDDGQKIL